MLKGLEIYEREKYPSSAARLVREPLDWDEALGRMPKLSGTPHLVELIIAHREKLYPFTDSRAPRWGSFVPGVLFGEGTGRSRAYKTRASRALPRRFEFMGMGVEVIRERPEGLLADYRPLLYNYVLALGAALRLTDRHEAYTQGGFYRDTPNVVFMDRGPLSANLFNRVYRKFGAGDPIVDALTRKHIPDLHVIWHFDIETDTAKARGSRMTSQMLDEIGEAHRRLPDVVAQATKESSRPIVIARIDANGRLADVKQTLAETLGTIVEGMRYG